MLDFLGRGLEGRSGEERNREEKVLARISHGIFSQETSENLFLTLQSYHFLLWKLITSVLWVSVSGPMWASSKFNIDGPVFYTEILRSWRAGLPDFNTDVVQMSLAVEGSFCGGSSYHTLPKLVVVSTSFQFCRVFGSEGQKRGENLKNFTFISRWFR